MANEITARQREERLIDALKEIDDDLKKNAVKNENIASIVLLCFFFVLAGVLLYLDAVHVIPAGVVALVYPLGVSLKRRGYINN
jgi:hypothetical protein